MTDSNQSVKTLSKQQIDAVDCSYTQMANYQEAIDYASKQIREGFLRAQYYKI